MPKYISDVFLYSSVFAVLICFLLAWICYKRVALSYRVLVYHVSFATVLNVAAMLLSYFRINNLPLLHLYTVVEFSFISFFFYYILHGKLKIGWVFSLIAVLLVLTIVNGVWYQGWFKFNTLPRSLSAFIIIVLCIICYYDMLVNITVSKIYNNPVFWINTGFLVYFSGSLFLFMMSNYILPLNYKLNILVWVIHALFSDALYLFISIGLWKARRT